MSELLSIWKNSDLTGATLPPPFSIPNNPTAHSIQINNQSRYWLILSKQQTGQDVLRMEPFSYQTMPTVPDLQIRIDTSLTNKASSLNSDNEFVDYSSIEGVIAYQKGSTQFSGGSTVNVSNANIDVNMPSGTNATIVNEQVPISQVFNKYASFTFPTNATSTTYDLQILSNGNMSEIVKSVFMFKSTNNRQYNLTSITAKAIFTDGSSFSVPSSFSISNNYGVFSTSTVPAVMCNVLTLTIQVTGNGGNPYNTSDNVTVYIQAATNDTSIDTAANYGVPIVPSTDEWNNASGTVTTANVYQTIIPYDATGKRKYIRFQNQSTYDMTILFQSNGVNHGYFIVQANYGELVFENSFCPLYSWLVTCSTAGAAFSCVYV